MSVVNQLGKGNGKPLFFVGGHFIQRDRFQILVRSIQNGAARRFVHAAAFHADQTVFHDIQKSDPVFATQIVERQNDLLCAHFLPVQGNRLPLLKIQRKVGGFVRRLHGGNTHFQKARLFILRFIAGVFQIQPFVGEVPEVFILGIVGFPADFERDMMRLGVVDLLFARFDAPFAPRGDDGHIGRKSFDGKFKAHLIVSFPGAAVSDRVGALGNRNFRQLFGNQRPGK